MKNRPVVASTLPHASHGAPLLSVGEAVEPGGARSVPRMGLGLGGPRGTMELASGVVQGGHCVINLVLDPVERTRGLLAPPA